MNEIINKGIKDREEMFKYIIALGYAWLMIAIIGAFAPGLFGFVVMLAIATAIMMVAICFVGLVHYIHNTVLKINPPI